MIIIICDTMKSVSSNMANVSEIKSSLGFLRTNWMSIYTKGETLGIDNPYCYTGHTIN